jgi:hypothetical protein
MNDTWVTHTATQTNMQNIIFLPILKKSKIFLNHTGKFSVINNHKLKAQSSVRSAGRSLTLTHRLQMHVLGNRNRRQDDRSVQDYTPPSGTEIASIGGGRPKSQRCCRNGRVACKQPPSAVNAIKPFSPCASQVRHGKRTVNRQQPGVGANFSARSVDCAEEASFWLALNQQQEY